MKRQVLLKVIVAGAAALGANFSLLGCDFNPVNYLSRNACDFVNCDVLFFVDDILPLSGGPIAVGGGVAAEASGDEEEEGHAH